MADAAAAANTYREAAGADGGVADATASANTKKNMSPNGLQLDH